MDEQVIIKNERLTASFALKGAELVSLQKEGKEYIWEGDPKVWAMHCPIVFPICGGLKEDKYRFNGREYTLGKHGFARFSTFTVEERTENSVTFALRSNEETLKSYPFRFIFFVKYTLEGSSLQVKYTVQNIDTKPLYYSVGGHEGYAIHGEFTDYAIQFEQKEDLNSYILEGNLLSQNILNVGKNTDTLPLNYKYFEVDALSFIDLKSRKVSLVNQKTGGKVLSVRYEGFSTLFLWTKPNAKYICIEPWAGTPDRTNADGLLRDKHDVIQLPQGGSKALIHTITIEE